MVFGTVKKTVSTAVCAVLVAGGMLASAAPAQAGETYAECMASTEGIETWGCYDLQIVPSAGPAGAVELTWTLNTSAEGFNNADWNGGFVLHRWPVEGQWKKYPPLERVDLPGPHENCNEDFNEANCFGVFSGGSGKKTIEFGPDMAGYVYEMYSHDYICSTDQNSCGPSGGAVDKYVFVLKAFQYKNKKGETVKSFKCPSKKQRKSACVPATILKLADTIGGGEPVPVP